MKNLVRMNETDCGLDVALVVMGGKWKTLILYHLRGAPKRFGDLKRLVRGISEKVLIQQLRELVLAEVLVRHDYQQVPPKVEYTITPFGMTLVEALLPLCEWGNEHRGRVEALFLHRSPEHRIRLSSLDAEP
ncbi:winged helix-turn-helix transcriptional regulator [Rhizobium panacihumi]|uniref:winged helix-turn-helix transcriptional regulator n=1 Tax=Rhizobium panacihumi TaxID=2008450 RepID=UPI003D79E3AB